MGSDVTDSELARRLRHLNFSADMIVDTLGSLTRLKIWDQAQTPARLQAIMKELLGATWAAVEGVSGVLEYTSGTAAGTFLADIIFTAAFVNILKMDPN